MDLGICRAEENRVFYGKRKERERAYFSHLHPSAGPIMIHIRIESAEAWDHTPIDGIGTRDDIGSPQMPSTPGVVPCHWILMPYHHAAPAHYMRGRTFYCSERRTPGGDSVFEKLYCVLFLTFLAEYVHFLHYSPLRHPHFQPI